MSPPVGDMRCTDIRWAPRTIYKEERRMRKGLATVAIWLAAATVVGVGVATAAPSPDKDFVTGGGFTGNGISHFAISAHNGPNGATGHVVLRGAGGVDTSGHVTCVT